MDWTLDHDILFCREIVSYDIHQYKAGSRERITCMEKIAHCLNSLDEPWFKVDQRALRDRLKKLIGQYITKKNEQQKASGIDVETTELDGLLEEIYEKKHEWEVQFTQVADDKNKKCEEEKKVLKMLETSQWICCLKLKRGRLLNLT